MRDNLLATTLFDGDKSMYLFYSHFSPCQISLTFVMSSHKCFDVYMDRHHTRVEVLLKSAMRPLEDPGLL